MNRILLSFIFLLSLNSVTIASDTWPSRLSVDIGFDDSNAQSQTLSIGHALIHELHMALSVGKHKNSDFNSDQFGLSLDSDPLASMQLGLAYDSWDSGGEFTSDRLSVLIGYNAEQWSFSVSPIQRDISIEVVNLRNQRREVDFSATGFTTSFNYFMASGFQAGVSYTKYEYSEDVTRLDPSRRPVVILFVSPIALSQAQGLDDYNLYFDLGYPFESLFLGLTIGQCRSAVDSRYSNMLVVNSDISLSDEWAISLSLGQQTSETSAVLFSNIGLSLYW